MSAPRWRLVGSAASLADLLETIHEREGWKADAVPTDDPRAWSVSSSSGIDPALRIRRAGNRYRYEMADR